MTLKNFPRGGKKPFTKSSTDVLNSNKKTSRVKNKKNKNKKIKKSTLNDEQFTVERADNLTLKSLSEGMIILGRIYEITKYDMIVSLPGRLSGKLKITDISKSYTKILKNITDSNNSALEEFKSLHDLYNTGDYIVCCIKSINPNDKWEISLSVEPHLINQHMNPHLMVKGSMIACNISAVEDHGFVMETGISNMRAFLKKPCNKEPYFVGKQVICAVKRISFENNICTAMLSTKSKYAKVLSDGVQSLDNMVPGTKYSLTIKRILINGLEVHYNGENVGYVNQIHLDKKLSFYSEDTILTGMLLYVIPVLKFAYFSCLLDVESNSVQIGDIIEEAKVVCREQNGILLKLDKKGPRGLLPVRRTTVDYDKINSVFIPGSKHKCRIISYDWMDKVYICTMEKNIMKEKYFTCTDLQLGQLVKVQITGINKESGFLNVVAGRILGTVPPEHAKNTKLENNIAIGQKIEARVLKYNKKRKRMIFTLNKFLVESNLPILHSITEAKVGSVHHGLITNLKHRGVDVQFFGDVKGLVTANTLNKQKPGGKWNLFKGQVAAFIIEKVDAKNNNIFLNVVTEHSNDDVKSEVEVKTEFEMKEEFRIGDEIEGIIIECGVDGIHVQIKDSKAIGFLPAGHLSPCIKIGSLLAARSIPGDTISASIFSVSPKILLTTTIVPLKDQTSLQTLEKGHIIACALVEQAENDFKVVVPIKEFEKEVSVPITQFDHCKSLYGQQILFGKILSVSKKFRHISLTMKLSEVWDNSTEEGLMSPVDTLSLYMKTVCELSQQPFYKKKYISSFNLGQRVLGKISKITDFGLVLNLDNNVQGTVHKDHYSHSVKVGDEISGTVIWIDYVCELVQVTLLPVLKNSISSNQKLLGSQITQGVMFHGEIILVTTWFVIIMLKGRGKGTLATLPVRVHLNDVQPSLKDYTFRKKVRCFGVLDTSEMNIPLPICMVKSAFEIPKPKMKIEQSIRTKLKRKNNAEDEDITEEKKAKIEDEVIVSDETKKKKRKKKINSEVLSSDKDECNKSTKTESIEQDSIEDISDKEQTKNEISNNAKSLSIPECGFCWDTEPNMQLFEHDDNSSSSDEDDVKNEPKKKKLSAAERREIERQKEREIREREEAIASSQMPDSVDKFDRLVLSRPNSSFIWLQYMAYHLQATEIEKARAVAKRAVKTINFREEEERLNVWQAWLNLESRFGTPESLHEVFQEAVRANDAKMIYLHMLTVHTEAGRHLELEKTVNNLVGKFKKDPEVWAQCGAAYLKANLIDKSRHMMQRALQSLPPSQHVNIMVKFALLENKLADKERAQTIFEQILSNYPKRTDVWIIYVDALVKSGKIEIARKVLEKAITQSVPAKKMKIIFKKFINFEEQHGSPENVDHVRQLAVEYVENQCVTNNT